jgi:AbiV family abortive infection protein
MDVLNMLYNGESKLPISKDYRHCPTHYIAQKRGVTCMSDKEQAVPPLTITQIFATSSKLMENAQELVEEAELLLENGRDARAFALAHLASQELIKFHFLTSVAVELARDHSVNWKKIDQLLRNHEVKIRGAILLDFIREPPQDGVYRASELSQRMSASGNLNAMKNYSLYVSQIGHDFVKPSELIDHKATTECVAHTREQLQIFRILYSAVSAITGMTEEGLRRFIEIPAFQTMLQALGSNTDLSGLPTPSKQQAIDEITAVFNDPAFRPLLTQFSSDIEQDLRSLTQAESQTRQDEQ